MSLIPNAFEAAIAAGLAYKMANIPIEFCFLLGYALAGSGSSISVPLMLNANEKGYGKDKGIGSSVIAAIAFDSIHTIIAFGICRTISEGTA